MFRMRRFDVRRHLPVKSHVAARSIPLIDPIPTSPLLAAERLRFERNEESVFGPLDFAVHEGEALLVMGGNGAGKTTLLRVLAGSLPAGEGRVLWYGEACARPPAGQAALLGHLPGHKAELTTLENLRFVAGMQGRRRGASPRSALEGVGLAGCEDVPAGRLSAGQRKRLSLARLILSPARVWLLDEPYANLDRDGIDLVNRLVARHLHERGAVLITTHGAYAAPPVRTRMLSLDADAATESAAGALSMDASA